MMMDSDYLDNIFDKAVIGANLIKNRKTLTIDYVPEKLPFRDEESKTIAQVLSVVLKNGRPSNLLVFGKPGTGRAPGEMGHPFPGTAEYGRGGGLDLRMVAPRPGGGHPAGGKRTRRGGHPQQAYADGRR